MFATPNDASNPLAEQALAEIAQLRRFKGPPAEFWPAFLAAIGQLVNAGRAILVLRNPAQPAQLKKLGDWCADGQPDRSMQPFNRALAEIVEAAAQGSTCFRVLGPGIKAGSKSVGVAILIPLPGAAEQCVAALFLPEATEEQAADVLMKLRLVADVPVSYRSHGEVSQARADSERFASVLDVMTLVNAEHRFGATSLALCNGLATRFNCDRVSLGWLEGGFVRLRTISRTERFDRNMAAVKAIEVIMEESLDQNEEILWPAAAEATVITRDHAAYSRDQSCANLCSLPLRVDDKPIGVLSCERQKEPFSPIEIQNLRLACDQVARRLSELKEHDRWFGARWRAALKEKFSKLLGPEHTWAKVAVIGSAIALVFLCVPIFSYRVQGTFVLRSDELAYLTSPFDGYIGEVKVRPGDVVQSGTALLKLDTADLELQEAEAVADLSRFTRETEKARAEAERLRARGGGLAEMRVNEALVIQTQAKLDIIRHRLKRAALTAPFNSIVVEGDLRQRIGAPVKQGDALFKLAKIDALYVEAEIDERDIHEMLNKSAGEIAFVTQPKLKFPISVTRIEPAASPKEGRNMFRVRCAMQGAAETWWRPGMSGVCKIDVEKRSLMWIITHRTVDFLRMFLWW